MTTRTIARRQAASLPTQVILPEPDPLLWWTLERVENPHPDVGPETDFPLAIRRQARRMLDDMRAGCAPVPPAIFDAWVRPILANVRNPLAGSEIPAKVALLHHAFAGYPTACFTIETQTEAMRRTVYLPAGGDLAPVLDGIARAWLTRQDGLTHIAGDRAETAPANRNVVPLPIQRGG